MIGIAKKVLEKSMEGSKRF